MGEEVTAKQHSTVYTTIGSVRGSCDHKHKSLATAWKCVRKDQRACAGLPGGNSYSDRQVKAVGRDLTEQELDELYDLDQWGHL
jgi:hypothetical protein